MTDHLDPQERTAWFVTRSSGMVVGILLLLVVGVFVMHGVGDPLSSHDIVPGWSAWSATSSGHGEHVASDDLRSGAHCADHRCGGSDTAAMVMVGCAFAVVPCAQGGRWVERPLRRRGVPRGRWERQIGCGPEPPVPRAV